MQQNSIAIDDILYSYNHLRLKRCTHCFAEIQIVF